jgi:hypothetical protein
MHKLKALLGRSHSHDSRQSSEAGNDITMADAVDNLPA